MLRIVHELSHPHRRFIPEDELFEPGQVEAARAHWPDRSPEPGISVRSAVTVYLKHEADRLEEEVSCLPDKLRSYRCTHGFGDQETPPRMHKNLRLL